VLPSVAWSGEFGIVRASDAAAGRVRNPIDADLETIVLKTLSKEPSRRYATADDLAADIDRYLAGEPIAARRDSVGYVLKTRVRRVSRRHRWTAFAVCLLVAITVANPVGVYVFYRLTGVNAWFERTMAQWAPLPERPRHLDDIRIIALTDDTDIGQIAEHEGLLDVNAREPRSLRRLHGRTMEKLASSSCKAVVWDVAFLGESPYDQSFVQGADALRDAGIPVIVAAQRWKLDADDKLGVSPAIAKADSVSVRCVAAGLDPSVPWRVQLCAKRGLDHPEPSLAIAAYAAFRMPRNQEVAPAFMLDATNRAVEVHYLRRGTRIRLGKPDRVLLTHLLPADDGSGAHASKYNLRPTDTVGLLRVDIADPADFEQITIEYVDVYTASTEQLRKQLDSRLVFFADLRTGVDRYGYAQRGELPGCYAHVAGVLTMLSASSIRDRGHKHKLELAQVFGAGLIGVALGARIARRSALRWLTLVLIALLLAAGSVAVFRVRGYLINPFPAMVSLACAAEFAAALARLVHSRID
jgi:CHASE2 domain-containing sensor protein